MLSKLRCFAAVDGVNQIELRRLHLPRLKFVREQFSLAAHNISGNHHLESKTRTSSTTSNPHTNTSITQFFSTHACLRQPCGMVRTMTNFL